MGSSKPKVECRSMTGGPYSRSGHLWTTEHTEVPEELLRDDDKMKLLEEDPHLEIRVDGEYRTGPRARKPGESAPEEPVDPETASTIKDMRKATRQLMSRVKELEDALAAAGDRGIEANTKLGELAVALDALTTEKDAAAKQLVELASQLAALKAAAPVPAPTATPTTDDTSKPASTPKK